MGAVLWPVVVQITPGILLGNSARHAVRRQRFRPSRWRCSLPLFVCLVAVQMILNLKPKSVARVAGCGRRRPRSVPASVRCRRWWPLAGARSRCRFSPGAMCACNRRSGRRRQSVFPIAVGGSLGYIFNGWEHPGLPQWSLGYVFSAGVHLAGAIEHADRAAGGKTGTHRPAGGYLETPFCRRADRARGKDVVESLRLMPAFSGR
jgi:hypothetical protein